MWSGKKQIIFASCCDRTLPMVGLETYAMMKMKLETRFTMDEATKRDANRQRAAFKAESKDRLVNESGVPTTMSFSESWTVDGFEDARLCARNPRPWWLNVCAYVTAVFCFLSWPYRMVLELKSIRVKVRARPSGGGGGRILE